MDRADGIMTRGAVDDLVPAGRIFNVASVLHTYWPLTPRAPRYAVILGIVFVLRLSRAYARRRHSTARTLQAVG